MAWLNRILWLKCRLTERAYSQTQGSRTATTLAMLLAFGAFAIFGVYLGHEVSTRPLRQVRELTHLVLAAVWVFWLSFPLFGHRVNESLDVTRLFLYPLDSLKIFLGSFLGNLLEPATLMVYPLFLALAGTLCPEPWLFLAALGVFALFLLHTVAASQLLLSLLLNLLKDRKVTDRLMVILPLLVAFAIWTFEFGVIFSSAGGMVLRMDLSTWLCWLPSGLAAEAVLALGRGDWGWAGYETAVLALLTFVTVALAARAAEWLLTRGDPSGAPPQRATTTASAPARGWGGRRWLVSVIAGKELRLLSREPQCRLILLLYLLMAGGALAIGALVAPESDRGAIIPAISYSLVFFFMGLMFNTFALERSGLRFMLTAPVHPVTVFVGKNLAYWSVISVLLLLAAGGLSLALGTGGRILAANVVSTQGLLISLLGVGNIVSVLSPYRLPSKGMMSQYRLTFGQVLWISLLGMAGLAAATAASLVCHFLLLPVLVTGEWKGFAETLVMVVVFVMGWYTLLTLLAAALFEWRSEKMVAAVSD